MNSWQGICAPAKTPAAVITRLNRDLNTALRAPDLREKLISQGNEVLSGTPQEHVETMRRDLAAMAKLVKAAGVQPE
jgi:tripartite-type tricarboxylate transporter receptor subunit TctC